MDIVPDDDHPYAWLAAYDRFAEELGRVRVPANFTLTVKSATAWVESGFRRPHGTD
jgi:hypothetical protein